MAALGVIFWSSETLNGTASLRRGFDLFFMICQQEDSDVKTDQY